MLSLSINVHNSWASKTNNTHIKEWEFAHTSCPCAQDEDALGSGRIAPFIRNLGTRWRWVVGLTSPSVYQSRKARNYWLWGWMGPKAVWTLSRRKRRSLLPPKASKHCSWMIQFVVPSLYMGWSLEVQCFYPISWDSVNVLPVQKFWFSLGGGGGQWWYHKCLPPCNKRWVPKIRWLYQSGKYVYQSGGFWKQIIAFSVDKICRNLPYVTN
jgi:hypothetical protein